MSQQPSSTLDLVESATVRGDALTVVSVLASLRSRARKVEGTLVDRNTGEPLRDERGTRLTARAKVQRVAGARRATYVFDNTRVPTGSSLATVSRPLRSPKPALLVAALVAVALMLLLPWHDPHAQKGFYDGATDEEIARAMGDKVAWYSMEISMKPTLTLRRGERVCEARIENVPANHCDQVVTLSLAGSGEEIYRSGAIGPGEHVQDITLTRSFEPGRYELLATFQGYDPALSLGANGGLLGHERFGASCNAEIELVCEE